MLIMLAETRALLAPMLIMLSETILSRSLISCESSSAAVLRVATSAALVSAMALFSAIFYMRASTLSLRAAV